jgi:hypothetical protein
MDRGIVYPGAIPLDTDLLSTNRNAMVGLGFLARAAFGTGTVVDGLAITPTGPASMVVNIGPGSIASQETVDATAYGSLALDTSDALVKMGINLTSTSFTLTAPGTSGQSINYLVEATFAETDGTAVVLPYYNSTNSEDPYSGPANSGTAQNTLRTQRASLQLKAGTAATTGTQTTPAVDSGWVGLYVITVNYGQTTITSGNLSGARLASAPFISAQCQGGAVASGPTSASSLSVQATFTPVRSGVVIANGNGGISGTSNSSPNEGFTVSGATIISQSVNTWASTTSGLLYSGLCALSITAGVAVTLTFTISNGNSGSCICAMNWLMVPSS